MYPVTYYNIQPTISFPISYVCLFCLYIFLSMRPGSREAILYRVLDISIIQTATFQNISGTLVYSNCNWCRVSVLIVPSFGPGVNVSIQKNLMSQFFPRSFSMILCIVKSASNFKKSFTSKFAWLTYSLLYYICCF